MTYVELNDEYNSIIDTRGIRNMYATSASVNCHFLKIDYDNIKDYYAYEYTDIVTLYEDMFEIKRRLGFFLKEVYYD